MKKAGWVAAIVLLVVTGLAGLNNGAQELGEGETLLQNSVAFGDALYGALGLAAAAGLARRRPWSVTLSAAWAVTVVYTATVASFAFHDPTFTQQGTLAGVIGACLGSAGIGALVVWAARVATRQRVPPPVPPAA